MWAGTFDDDASEEQSMRTEGSDQQNSRHIAAFVAAALFYVAGTAFVVLSFSPRQAVPLFLGALFLFVGSIWVVIGAKYKKDAEQGSR
jgi:hypothetical protein